MCYLGQFEKTVEVIDQSKASKNVLEIKKSTCGAGIGLALVLI